MLPKCLDPLYNNLKQANCTMLGRISPSAPMMSVESIRGERPVRELILLNYLAVEVLCRPRTQARTLIVMKERAPLQRGC